MLARFESYANAQDKAYLLSWLCFGLHLFPHSNKVKKTKTILDKAVMLNSGNNPQ